MPIIPYFDAIRIVTVIFILIGFLFTDALMKISEKPYDDPESYTPAYVNTTAPAAQTTTMRSSDSKTAAN